MGRQEALPGGSPRDRGARGALTRGHRSIRSGCHGTLARHRCRSAGEVRRRPLVSAGRTAVFATSGLDALVPWRARLDATPTLHGHPEPYPSAGRPGAARPAIACSLAAGEMPERMTDWQAALDDVRNRAPLDGGLRLELGPGADLGRLARLLTAE